MALRSSFVGILSLALPLALVACSGSTSCPCPPTVPNPLDPESNAVVQALNIQRGMAGVSSVSVCKSLNVSAAGHSDDMRDNSYLNEISPTDGSDVRTRACKAGYAAACGTTILMAEFVAEGNGTGATTFAQWATDPTAGPDLVKPGFTVVGVGRSVGAANEYWTLDLAAVVDPSCN